MRQQFSSDVSLNVDNPVDTGTFTKEKYIEDTSSVLQTGLRFT